MLAVGGGIKYGMPIATQVAKAIKPIVSGLSLFGEVRNTPESLFQSLQVRADLDLGYRPVVGVYEVRKNVRVPTGIVSANPILGIGGGDQFFINNFEKILKLTNKIELEKKYEYMPTYRLHP